MAAIDAYILFFLLSSGCNRRVSYTTTLALVTDGVPRVLPFFVTVKIWSMMSFCVVGLIGIKSQSHRLKGGEKATKAICVPALKSFAKEF